MVPPLFIVILLPHLRLTLLHDLTPLLKFINLLFYCSLQSMATIPFVEFKLTTCDNFSVKIISLVLYCFFSYLSNISDYFFNLKLFNVTVMLLNVIAIDANIGFIVIPNGDNTPIAIGIIQIL